jgi:peptidylprolyl isomerase
MLPGLRYAVCLIFLGAVPAWPVLAKPPAEIINASPASDWRPLDPDNTLVMQLGGHSLLIELAPRFAPLHVVNIRRLAQAHFWDGLAVVRVQDNFVAQWGDPDADRPGAMPRPLGKALPHLPAEFEIPAHDLPIAALPDADGWAPVSGFVDGFPVAADPTRDRAWITHCYGVVGAGRDLAPDSSTGAELYAIIGQSPRMLDRNITVVGRVLQGMETLAALPRGQGAMGFYQRPAQRSMITSVRLLADLPQANRPDLEVLKTDSATWQALVAERRNPSDDFHLFKANFTNVCNLNVPVRNRARR